MKNIIIFILLFAPVMLKAGDSTGYYEMSETGFDKIISFPKGNFIFTPMSNAFYNGKYYNFYDTTNYTKLNIHFRRNEIKCSVKDTVEHVKRGDLPCIEFTSKKLMTYGLFIIDEIELITENNKNGRISYNAHISVDDYNLYVSLQNHDSTYNNLDELYKFIDGIKVLDKYPGFINEVDNEYKNEAGDLFIRAEEYYKIEDYKKALNYYTSFLNISMQVDLMREMVITAYCKQAKCSILNNQINTAAWELENAIKNYDNTNPNFYYLLSCCYAKENNSEKTIEYLTKAYQYKQNDSEIEKLPDPLNDQYFQDLLKDNDFRKQVEKLME